MNTPPNAARTAGILFCLMTWLTLSSQAEDIATISKAIETAWSQVQTLSASVHFQAHSARVEAIGEGTVVYRLTPQGEECREDLIRFVEIPEDGLKRREESASIRHNTDIIRRLIEDNKKPKYKKITSGLSNGATLGGAHIWRIIAGANDLTFSGTELIDDRETYIIEGVLKHGMSGRVPYERIRFNFDIKTGLCLRQELNRQEDEWWMCVTRTLIEPPLPISDAMMDIKSLNMASSPTGADDAQKTKAQSESPESDEQPPAATPSGPASDPASDPANGSSGLVSGPAGAPPSSATPPQP